jgi:polyphosphate glucokinase
MKALGIDVGGSGIKGALVDTERGWLLSDRHRIATPSPAAPDAVGKVVADLVAHFGHEGAVGCALPAVVKGGTTWSAANIDPAFIGLDTKRLFESRSSRGVRLVNDADAAGLAEMRFGAGLGHPGVVMVLTLGTGIGSALFVDGRLVPNTELGHLEIRGKEAERRASDRTRQNKSLSWKKWSKRLTEYLRVLERLFSPDLFILGGGVSKKHEQFVPRLQVKTETVPAALRNEAGIIGAALACE